MSSDALLSAQNIEAKIAEIAESDAPVVSPETQFLKLALEVKTPVLLSVLNLVEILTIATNQVVPVFQLPPWVMGVYNWRGDILWVVDLNHLIGCAPWYRQENYASKHTVVVLKGQSKKGLYASGELVLGLAVNRVDDMVICEPELIKAIEKLEIPDTINSFLKGSLTEENGKYYWVLDGEKVLSVMPKEEAIASTA
ncbi:MAG: chemotaxis protein CheW [Leptolyngbya sp. SIO1D8]|nr:chemotaxis protein CheW [Leptolyngbya sp. SIO1D8]